MALRWVDLLELLGRYLIGVLHLLNVAELAEEAFELLLDISLHVCVDHFYFSF